MPSRSPGPKTSPAKKLPVAAPKLDTVGVHKPTVPVASSSAATSKRSALGTTKPAGSTVTEAAPKIANAQKSKTGDKGTVLGVDAAKVEKKVKKTTVKVKNFVAGVSGNGRTLRSGRKT